MDCETFHRIIRKSAEKHGINVPPESDAFIARSLRLKDGKQEGAVKLVLLTIVFILYLGIHKMQTPDTLSYEY